MARRKGVSKSRNSGARKLITESSSSSKQESKLKNDPGEKSHRDMDESELISKKVSRNSEDYQRKSGVYVNSLSHRNTNPDQILIGHPVNITQSETTNSIDLINSNNNNSKAFNNTSNKYLHKKFKRIASATINEVQSNKLTGDLIAVTPIVPKHKEESSKPVQNSDSQIENFVNANNSYSLNGHRVNFQLDSGKNQIILNGESNEGQRIFCNSNVNSPKIQTRKSSPCADDNSRISSVPKIEKTSLIVNANHNNNVLNRISLITSNCTNSSSSSSSSPISTAVVSVGTQQRTTQHLQSQRVHQREVLDQNFSGRHVCPYCNLNCTKPSVLQKHIRAHTNERPYPCDTCGFAFKTKSNYYKHCRSRSHALRTKGGEAQPDDEGSMGSDQDPDPELSNSSSDVISRTASPMDDRTSSPAIQQQAVHQVQKCLNEKPYKPKFHNAALYAKEEISQQQQKQLQHQYQQYNSLSHQNQMGSNYYPHPQYPHQHRQQQEQHEPHEQQHLHFQHQTARIRLDLTPPTIPNSQNFQQASLSGCVDTTPSSSCSSIREPTSSSFNGIAIAVGGHQLNREFLQEHISKIISQNEAIVENKEILLQKKYPKLSGKSKCSPSLPSNEGTNSKLAFALASKQQHSQGYRDEVSASKSHIANNSLGSNNHATNSSILTIARSIHEVVNQVSSNSEALSTQPLNLSKIVEQAEIARKRSSVDSYSANSSESTTSAIVKTGPIRPQIQERSIIKHLLLNARGLGVPNGEGEDAVYTCPLCKMDFRSAEDLRLHTSNYCQGGPASAPISPVASPSYKYFRSNSINVNLPEFNNPNSLAKLARSSLLHLSRNPLSLAKLAWSQLKTKPSNLVLNQLNVNTNTTTASSSGNCDSSSSMSSRAIDTPLPSPGPLLGKTPLIEAYNNSERKSEDVIITKVHDEQRVFTKDFSPKRLKLNNFTVSCEGGTVTGRSNAPGYNIASAGFEGNQVKIQPTQQTYAMCGGDVQLLEKREDRMKRFHSSGGCMIPISECPDVEMSPKMIRTPLLSGGSFSEVLAKPSGKDSVNTPSTTPKMMIPIAPLTPSVPGPNLLNAGLPLAQHFQFPPINSITAFNPLTLPPIAPTSVLHGDKLIPFVPGIPGPNTLAPSILHPQIANELHLTKIITSSGNKTKSLLQNSIGMQAESSSHHVLSPRHQVVKPIIRIENDVATPGSSSALGDSSRTPQKSPRHWPSTVATTESGKKSFNFTRMADNLSPRKPTFEKFLKSTDSDQDRDNFDSEASSKADLTSGSQIFQSHQLQHAAESTMMPLHVDVTSSNITTSKDSSEFEMSESKSKVKSKFLRPTSLPLKPGTFTPKRHHGITPTANTLPLISPETPRPSKACIQLYLNGHAYTYLGLKCSTKMFYCTVNCPQPSYVANLHKLSMYSVWQVCAENNPHPLGLKPKTVMSLYDSRQRVSSCTTAAISLPYTTVHSQSTVMTPFESIEVMGGQFYHHQVKAVSPCSDVAGKNDSGSKSNSNVLVGGYESNEDYTYIRGRGRGRYVCSECGIRCKKPSMLKKHIRTHTDVRPYTCQHCSFSFKTKGNLTKHMQSKTHYKKCLELGISPGPMLSEGDYMDTDGDTDQQSTISGGGRTSSIQGESDTDDYSDLGDNETESSDTDESKSRLLEHEAARCLLSLSMTPPVMNSTPGRTQYGSYRQQTLLSESVSGRADESSAHGFTTKRVISFTSPKPPFDYQKQEQYYSNPSIPKNRDDKFDELSMKPIDLTKPRQVSKYKLSDIIGDLSNETSLLKSLVSITDMVRNNTESMIHKVDDSVLLQAYLTEQALKYTKIKQSQMSRNFAEISNGSTLSTMTTAHTKTVNSNFSKYDLRSNVVSYPEKSSMSTACITTDSLTKPIAALVENEDVQVKKEVVQVSNSNSSLSSTAESRRETSLSPSINQTDLQVDLESKPPVPDNPSLPLVTSQLSETSKDVSISPRPKSLPPGTGGAKSVASEYLKMTSAEYLKSRGNRTEESEESSSDQEIAVTDPSAIKPPTEFTGVLARTVIVGEDGFKSSSSEVQPMFPRVPLSDDGRPVCTICSKTFQKQHQMVLHMNIHYMERKFKCEPCAVSFRTQGHLQKHERSEAHKNKVMMTSTFGVPTTSNPRPFECSDCKVAFRIHGHLAKHLRSKTHVQKLECLQKLPFGTYAEIERAGISLTEIDTTDCDNSLASLKALAQKLIEKDPNKLNSYNAPSCIEGNLSGGCSYESGGEDSPLRHSDGGDAIRDVNELSMLPLRSSVEGSGVKRKLDSFSSCSNDSMVNAFQQQDIVHEKRPRTTSET